MFSETWKLLFSIGMALLVQFGGVVWVASSVNLKTEQNEVKITLLEKRQTEAERLALIAATKIEIFERKVDKIEDLLLKIWEKIK